MEIKEETPMIFIINLKKDTQKKEHMQKLCEKNHHIPLFIEAIYGNDLNEDSIAKVYSKELALKYMGRELTRGEIGTALSHLSIYRQMVEQNIETALIFEDDVEFNFDDKALIEIVQSLPRDWECVMLGHHTKRSRDIDTLPSYWHKKEINSNLYCIRFAEEPFGAYGYLINQEGASKMLNYFEVIDRPIDHWSDRRINLYGMMPSIVHISNHFLDCSSLSPERTKMKEKTYRTFFQTCKDKVRLVLETLSLVEQFYALKNFLVQFKRLRRYRTDG